MDCEDPALRNSEGHNNSTIKAINVKAARTLTERRQKVAMEQLSAQIIVQICCSHVILLNLDRVAGYSRRACNSDKALCGQSVTHRRQRDQPTAVQGMPGGR